MSKGLNIEELVRRKLGQAEIIPSAGVWRGVERRVRAKQFLRFDPGRFNAVYLAGILAAGTLTATLLLSPPQPQGPGGPQQAGTQTGIPAPESFQREAEDGINPLEPESGRRDVAEKGAEVAGNQSKPTRPVKRIPADLPEVAAKAKEAGSVNAQNITDPGVQDAGEILPENQAPVSRFTASSTSGCAPLRVVFISESLHATSLEWSFGTGERSEGEAVEYTYSAPGKYTVTLVAGAKQGEGDIFRQVIVVHPAPDAGFDIVQGQAGTAGEGTIELFNYSIGAVSYSWKVNGEGWSSDAFQPILPLSGLTTQTRMVSLVAVNSFGCSDTAMGEIPAALVSPVRALVFPTAFSPSQTGPTGGIYGPNDRKTDLFHPQFTEVPATYHLQVFTRTGELLFETRDIYQGWDGYYLQERSAVGVYLWKAGGSWEDGSAYSLRGDITLLGGDPR